MLNRLVARSVTLALLLTGSGAQAASQASSGYLLKLSVPVTCTLRHQGGLAAQGNGFQLGELQEFCNAPGGYSLLVDYTPGTMRGASVQVGDERVVLDGSGESIVSRAAGPRIRARTIFAVAGPKGFDTERLDFNIVPS